MTAMRRISCCAIVRRGNAILLQLKKKYGQWELPGGKLDGTETAWQCVHRELEEETGLHWLEGRLLGYVDHRDKYGCVIFECTKWDGAPKIMEPDKQTAIGWFEVLPDQLTDDTKSSLEAVDFWGKV